ncbi:MAG: hypothetical protein JKY50_11000 [Oleispira sp.]|nr:hypothetical protein [Oleispira sp.]MBL4880600.1 hypothetical protein [Oleispira sp.]
MDDIYCLFFDEEIDQDLPSQPENSEEAISIFRKFQWQNKHAESTMKLLIFKSSDGSDPSVFISCLTKDKWCVDTSILKRRQYLGPFFRKTIFRTFIDLGKSEVEELLRSFYGSSPGEFIALLERNESGEFFSC